jgi:hypothetical protein
LEAVEVALRKTEEGKALVDAVYENRSELMNLINNDREVGVVWQRGQGPAFVGHVLKYIRDENHQIPDEINGVQLQNSLLNIAFVLESKGSPALASAIDEFSLQIFNLVNDLSALKDMVE